MSNEKFLIKKMGDIAACATKIYQIQLGVIYVKLDNLNNI